MHSNVPNLNIKIQTSNVKKNFSVRVSFLQSTDQTPFIFNRQMKNEIFHEIGFPLKSLRDSAAAGGGVGGRRRAQDQRRHHQTQNLQRHVRRRRRTTRRRRILRVRRVSSTSLVGEVPKEADEMFQDASVEIGQSLLHDLAGFLRVRRRGKTIVIKASRNNRLPKFPEPLLQRACQRVNGEGRRKSSRRRR